MLSCIWIFLFTQICYHLLVTVLWYGVFLIDQSNLALLRDWARILLCLIGFLLNIKQRKSYFKALRKVLLAFVFLILFSCGISYLLFHKTVNELLIGIKYGIWWMIILLSASWLGFFYQKSLLKYKETWKKILKWSLLSILLLWWVWQWLKLISPDIFFSFWYWKLDDFHYWENPPIYYLTGYEGTLRRQWLFAWPNNYWYFLILFLPLFLYFFPLKEFRRIKEWNKTDWGNFLLVLLWVVSIIATISRAAIIWCCIIFLLLNIAFLKKHKKASSLIGILLLVLLFWISYLKRDSTVSHLQAKRNGVQEVINQPLWYWLWSSWPAVHHTWAFLPENYYLQLMLDMGTIWFLIRCWVVFLWLFEEKKLRLRILAAQEWDNEVYQIFLALQTGFIALLVMGFFLHVFEDSMVNYLFFVLYWLALWYFSALHPHDKTP